MQEKIFRLRDAREKTKTNNKLLFLFLLLYL